MDISQIITKTIADSPTDAPRNYIGASSIGKPCSRAIWYGFTGAESTNPPPSLRTTFEIGKRLEGLLIDYLEESGFKIVRPNSDNDYLLLQDKDVPVFQGHCDALMILPNSAPSVVEIKTANTASFSKFKAKGLRVWNDGYYAQLQAYLGMSGYPRGVLLAIDKNTSELHHEWVNYDDIFYHELKSRALNISQMEEPPEKLNKNPIYFLCNSCSYRKICHA